MVSVSVAERNDVALGLELAAQLGVVVDLAVEGDPDRAVLVGHGLAALRAEVDDRQPGLAQADRTVRPDAAAVRPAVAQGAVHAGDQGGIGRPARVAVQNAVNAAHVD